MKHILHKRSLPDAWTKEFDTEDAARIELLRYVCGECLSGELEMVGTDEKHPIPLADQSSIASLLGTPCGCEYEYEAAQ